MGRVHIIPSDMVTQMKTTLEISDNLFRRAKQLAEREGKTFNAVIEKALVTRLEAREQAAAPYLLEIPVMSGKITLEFLNAQWEKIRDELYVYLFAAFPPDVRTQKQKTRIEKNALHDRARHQYSGLCNPCRVPISYVGASCAI